MAKEEFEKHEKLISQTKNLNAEVQMLDEVSELVKLILQYSFPIRKKNSFRTKFFQLNKLPVLMIMRFY